MTQIVAKCAAINWKMAQNVAKRVENETDHSKTSQSLWKMHNQWRNWSNNGTSGIDIVGECATFWDRCEKEMGDGPQTERHDKDCGKSMGHLLSLLQQWTNQHRLGTSFFIQLFLPASFPFIPSPLLSSFSEGVSLDFPLFIFLFLLICIMLWGREFFVVFPFPPGSPNPHPPPSPFVLPPPLLFLFFIPLFLLVCPSPGSTCGACWL